VRHSRLDVSCGSIFNFNPRTREGCDEHRERRRHDPEQISTHAPAKGATRTTDRSRHVGHISTHAPAKGATPAGRNVTGTASYFNPRTREGCDRGGGARPPPRPISTHAPAKGATLTNVSAPNRAKFQPTHPRRVRLDYGYIPTNGFKISTHAPAKGATP